MGRCLKRVVSALLVSGVSQWLGFCGVLLSPAWGECAPGKKCLMGGSMYCHHKSAQFCDAELASQRTSLSAPTIAQRTSTRDSGS